MVERSRWGQGLASEGARACLDHAARELEKRHVISVIHPANVASICVAHKLGERLEGEAEIFGTQLSVYGMDLPAA